MNQVFFYNLCRLDQNSCGANVPQIPQLQLQLLHDPIRSWASDMDQMSKEMRCKPTPSAQDAQNVAV